MLLRLANIALLSSSEVTLMMTVEDVLGSPSPKPIHLACLSVSSLGSREKASLPQVDQKSRALSLLEYRARVWPPAEPHLAQTRLVIFQFWDAGYVSEPPLLHLEEGNGHNIPNCYGEECLAYSRCSIKCLLQLEFLKIVGNVSSDMALDHNKHFGTGFYALPEENDPTTLDISLVQTLKGQSYVLHSHPFPPEASLWNILYQVC